MAILRRLIEAALNMDHLMDLEYRCDHLLPLLSGEVSKTFEGLEFYLKTLEEFITSEREKEIAALKQDADALPKERQGDFWAWHYPVHWDEIFASQLRSSFVVTVISLAESHLGVVSEQACEIAGAPLRAGDLRGGFFERHRKCLESLAGFTRPDASAWESVLGVRDIRNCIVHANSRIRESPAADRLKVLVAKLPGITSQYDVIQLSPEFPVHALSTVCSFVDALYDEAGALCKRRKMWRPQP
ncbi:MAG TPA: hypothetical protein VJ860_16425 [Polyangia bacterium]|nr:hypothetical protein [Polyangia bacterium]